MSIIRPHQSRRCSKLRGRLRKRPPELADGYDHTIDKRPPELADGYDRITDPGVVIKETERNIQKKPRENREYGTAAKVEVSTADVS